MIAQVRYAQPTTDLARIRTFYGDLLGLPEVAAFEGHDGYDGVVFACPDDCFHLEFTRSEHHPVYESSDESLLVLYIPGEAFDDVLARIRNSGARELPSANPYWDRHGRTFLDPDGRRVVVYKSAGISAPQH